MPRQALARIVLIGALAAVLVTAAGRLFERVVLGADEADARARVEVEVHQVFDVMSRRLRDISDAVADAPLVRAAAAEDTEAARLLFERADGAIAETEAAGDTAVTVFAPDGEPLAWAGRPSELRREQLARGEAWFLSRFVLGPRLVYVRPLLDGASTIGIVAVERALPSAEPSTPRAASLRRGSAPITVATRAAAVSVHLPGDPLPEGADVSAFGVDTPAGQPLLVATVDTVDLQVARDRVRLATRSLALVVFAVAMVLLAGPLLDWRNRARRSREYAIATLLTAGIIVAARAVARAASTADWAEAALFSAAEYAGTFFGDTPFRLLLTSPFDFLLTAAAAGGLVALLMFAIEAWRLRGWRDRRVARGATGRAVYVVVQVAAGLAFAGVLVAHEALLQNTIANSDHDLLHLSLQQWDTALVALQVGLIIAHATMLGLAVAILRAAIARWSVPRRDRVLRVTTVAAWLLPLVVWRLVEQRTLSHHLPLLVAGTAAVLLALYATRLTARYRHGSQAFRLTLLTLGLVVPAAAFYPTLFQLARQAKAQLVQSRYAKQALDQRENVQTALRTSLAQIDAIDNLMDYVTRPAAPDEAMSDRAFQLWQATVLAGYPVTSSIEIFGPDRNLVSRFAFNLPEDPTASPTSEETTCGWESFAEVNPFFAEERRVLHAGRQLCDPVSRRPLGSIVVHAMLEDYENLPFIQATSPYVELLRSPDPMLREGFAGRDIEYAVYGWSRIPLFASGNTAWPLPDAVFARAVESREAFWEQMRRGGTAFDVYVLNNRGGIYALGFPVVSALDHLVHLAELTVLAALTYLLLLAANALFGMLGRRGTTAPALLREIRASFYRKLFIAFVAAVFVPVVLLAIVTRVYIADRMRTDIEEEAVRTASAAGRVVQDLVGPRADNPSLDDNLLVWVSRLVDQDVNMFADGRLVATSERNLFASGFLPTRTPAEVHHALELRRESAIVIRERVGSLSPYLVAGTRLFEDGILTVPLTARQQEIEQEIETLDRRVLLAALFFIFGGSLLGYWFAERISDPVNRLTRATRRIARGDLDARIAATSSDELRRLVEDFNSMARDLQQQRAELERTNRLEAWAEMARQVAHEIKNPLTPIQLNAEHLRRVHADRGHPLGPVLQQCVETILSQVKLLRQIASEFSSFAASPTAKRTSIDVPELLHEIVDPYRAGLAGRIRFEVDIPERLPLVFVDRTLIARSLTNIVENALHAMPGEGTLAVTARADDHHVRIRVSDTGVGMDADALARAFEPYFSTKASGTGLGLPIAKRNVELSGGTIAVTSERDRGTAVELQLPAVEQANGVQVVTGVTATE
jgi:signal transduction histidine kinase